MKNRYNRLLMLLMVTLIGATKLQAQCGWQPVGVPDTNQLGLVNYAGSGGDIVADRNGVIYAAGYRKNSELVVKKFDGTFWQQIGDSAVCDSLSWIPSLAVDSNNVVYILYAKNDNPNLPTLCTINVKKFDGTNWVPVGPQLAQTHYSQINDCSFKLDRNNVPYIFGQFDGAYKLIKFDGSNWITLSTDGQIGQPNYSCDFAIDNNNTPYIAFTDHAKNEKITVNKFNGSMWDTVGTTGFSVGTADYIKLIIDNGNTPYVAYQDAGNGNKIAVKKYDGVNWVSMGSTNVSTGETYNSCMAVDSNNVVYISFSDSVLNGGVTVKKFDGTNWQTLGAIGLPNSSVNTIVCGAGNTLYLTGIFTVSEPYDIQTHFIYKYDGTSWNYVGNQGVSSGLARNVCLKMDTNNVPYIAYKDVKNGNKISVKKFDGTNWITLGLAGFSTGEVDFVDLAIDRNNVPYVVFSDYSLWKRTTVMKFDGTSWVNVGSPGFSNVESLWSSIAIDTNNIPFVIYVERGSWVTAVKKYNGSSWVGVGNLLYYTAYTATIEIDKNNTPYIALYNSVDHGTLKVMKLNGSTWMSIDSSIHYYGYYPSICFDQMNRPYIATIGNGVYIFRFDGSLWSPIQINAPLWAKTKPTLAADGHGNIYVSCSTGYGTPALYKFDGNNWQELDNFSSANDMVVSASATVAVGKDNVPYLAYGDIGAYVIKYTSPITDGISGDSSVCIGNSSTYSINADSNYTYVWNYPSGWVGSSSSNSITLIPGVSSVSGDISVQVSDGTCTSQPSTLHLTPNTTPTASFVPNTTTNSKVVTILNSSTGGSLDYAWDYGNGDTSSISNNSYQYTYPAGGSYTITLVVSNACGSDTTSQTVGITLGINEYELNSDVTVIPNPFQESLSLSIESPQESETAIVICDMVGRVIYNSKIELHKGKNTIPLNDIFSKSPGGTYSISIQPDNFQRIIKKVVKLK